MKLSEELLEQSLKSAWAQDAHIWQADPTSLFMAPVIFDLVPRQAIIQFSGLTTVFPADINLVNGNSEFYYWYRLNEVGRVLNGIIHFIIPQDFYKPFYYPTLSQEIAKLLV